MSNKLSPEQREQIRCDYERWGDSRAAKHIPALLDHCTALEEELRSAQNELSKAARLINCAGPLDHRVQMMKLDYSGQIAKLEEELKAAQGEIERLRKTDERDEFTAGKVENNDDN